MVPAPSESAAVPPTIPILSPALWQDPDVRWLTGAHEAKDVTYFVKESYEELLWWLQLPALCKLAAQPVPSRSALQEIGDTVSEATNAAATASYRLDALFASADDRPELVKPAATHPVDALASPKQEEPLPAKEKK